MTRVYLVRHGTTDWNKEEIFRGRVDCQLNETGQAEASALAAYFRDVPREVIYSSPLSRATETARAIAGARSLQVISAPAFIDIDFGEWHGIPLKEVKEKYAELYRLWREQPQKVTFPGGENLAKVRARAWQGLMRMLQENPEKTILIVSHRVITKVLICAILGLDDSHFWQIKQDTTAVNCFEHSRGIFITSLINDTCHLKSIHAGTLRKDF
ncbi:MAG: histidine phosphatase family protein [Deltaproteobacteria bacterium]|nr:histidine phosphatase family protein [Deltaproteobacteria bacterium]